MTSERIAELRELIRVYRPGMANYVTVEKTELSQLLTAAEDAERIGEWQFVAEHQERLINGIFETLRQWHDRATRLPEGYSGNRPWIVTKGDIDHLQNWSDFIRTMIRQGPMNAPHKYTCESLTAPAAGAGE